MNLQDMNEILLRIESAVRTAQRLTREADDIKLDALMSGAMLGEFSVCHVYRSTRNGGITTRLQ